MLFLPYIPLLSLSHPQSMNPYLNQVVKVVLPSYPAIVGLQTVRLVGDVFGVQTFTVVELAFEQLERKRERGLQGYLTAIYTLSKLHQSLQPFKPTFKSTIKAGNKRTFHRAHSYQFSLSARLKAGLGVMLSLFTLNLIVILSKLTLLRNKSLQSIEYSRHFQSPSSHNHIWSYTRRLTFKLQRVRGFVLKLRKSK